MLLEHSCVERDENSLSNLYCENSLSYKFFLVSITRSSTRFAIAFSTQSRRDATICSRGRQSPVSREIVESQRDGTDMSSSYVSNHVYIVFSTKERMRAISEMQQPKLWAYMAGIATNHGMHALAIGGIEDHVHALIALPGAISIAKGTQVLKANSSRWLNEGRGTRFEWQEGYFACSVSRSQISRVMKYIANQREHHKKRDFAAEMAWLLKAHGFEDVPSLRDS
jgi:putative transposase